MWDNIVQQKVKLTESLECLSFYRRQNTPNLDPKSSWLKQHEWSKDLDLVYFDRIS